MNTNKQRVIKAIEDLTKTRYIDGIWLGCPLCIVFPKTEDCRGCPSAGEDGLAGCLDQPTFKTWRRKKPSTMRPRREKWEKALPIIKKLPDKQFTPSGWKYLGDNVLKFMWEK